MYSPASPMSKASTSKPGTCPSGCALLASLVDVPLAHTPCPSGIHDMKLNRLRQHCQRLRDDLDRPMISVSEASMSCVPRARRGSTRKRVLTWAFCCACPLPVSSSMPRRPGTLSSLRSGARSDPPRTPSPPPRAQARREAAVRLTLCLSLTAGPLTLFNLRSFAGCIA